MRKLKRAMARAHMRETKIPSINKRLYVNPNPSKSRKVSFFSLHWREWIAGNPHTKKSRKRKTA